MNKISALTLLFTLVSSQCFAAQIPFEVCTGGNGSGFTKLVLKSGDKITADLDSGDISLRGFVLDWTPDSHLDEIEYSGGSFYQKLFVSFEHGTNAAGQVTFLVPGKGGVALNVSLTCNPI